MLGLLFSLTKPCMTAKTSRLPAALPSALLLIGIVTVYWPVTAGTFFFDDFANLPSLGQYGPIDSWAALVRYLTSGIADPTGRPVSVASFLIDARDWPAEPFAFKRTNVLIHATNGLLLAWVLARLGVRAGLEPRHARAASIAAAAIWALHPLWVSTVGYVVQRHAMLPVPFVLLGILAWMKAIESIEQARPARAWLYGGVLVPLCTLLATLSKANGALLPLMLAALHPVILGGPTQRPPLSTGMRRHLLSLTGWSIVLPATALLGWLVFQIDWDASGRPWTLVERLMTQPRALFDYLGLLAWPRVDSAGIFSDGFPLSTSLLSPWTTLPALAGLLGLLSAAVLVRLSRPVLSATLLFFLAGHLMESSVVPLELYFEHRSYLPALLMGWPIAIWLTEPGTASRRWKLALLSSCLAVLSLLCHARASIWGQTEIAVAHWARAAPDSPRAQTTLAQLLMVDGQHAAAYALLDPLLDSAPDNAMFALNLLSAACPSDTLIPADLGRIERALEANGMQADVVHESLRWRAMEEERSCPALDGAARRRLIEAASRGTSPATLPEARRLRVNGYLLMREGDCAEGIRHLRASYEAAPYLAELYIDTAVAASNCTAQQAITHLTEARALSLSEHPARPGMPSLHRWVLRRQGYWASELDRLEQVLRRESRNAED